MEEATETTITMLHHHNKTDRRIRAIWPHQRNVERKARLNLDLSQSLNTPIASPKKSTYLCIQSGGEKTGDEAEPGGGPQQASSRELSPPRTHFCYWIVIRFDYMASYHHKHQIGFDFLLRFLFIASIFFLNSSFAFSIFPLQ